MPEWPRLTRAPIVEALIDLSVELPSQVGLGELARMQDELREEYPQRRERFSWQAQWKLGQEPAAQGVSGGPDGYLFTSANGQQVVQARLDGFTFSRLRPYQDWETLCQEARRVWAIYRRIARVTRVRRTAVRYINRLALPMPVHDLADWIVTRPVLAPTLPGELDGIFLRLVMPFADSGATAILTEAVEEGTHEGSLPLILDIDVFAAGSLDPAEEGLWTRMDALRQIKNRIFFGSVTQRSLELVR